MLAKNIYSHDGSDVSVHHGGKCSTVDTVVNSDAESENNRHLLVDTASNQRKT